MYTNDYLLDNPEDQPLDHNSVEGNLLFGKLEKEKSLMWKNLLLPGTKKIFDFLEKLDDDEEDLEVTEEVKGKIEHQSKK